MFFFNYIIGFASAAKAAAAVMSATTVVGRYNNKPHTHTHTPTYTQTHNNISGIFHFGIYRKYCAIKNMPTPIPTPTPTPISTPTSKQDIPIQNIL
jgi:hypothetical protein